MEMCNLSPLRYGSSIQQGGVASRAGNLYDAIVGRRLSREILNFGFAGNGHEDIGVAKHIAKLAASVIVLDCLPNMNPATVKARKRYEYNQPSI